MPKFRTLRPDTPIFSLVFLLLAWFVCGIAIQDAYAEDKIGVQREIETWDRILGVAERFARGPADDPREARRLRTELRSVEEEANAVKQPIERDLKASQDLLQAIGPEPKKDEPPEARAVAERRAQYQATITRLQAQKSLVDLALKRAGELDQAISTRMRTRLIERVLEPSPLPFGGETLAVAGREFATVLSTLAVSPLAWYRDLPERHRQALGTWRGGLIVFVALFAAAFARRFLRRHFGRHVEIEQPSYARRVVGAIAEGIAGGVVPAAILGGLYLIVTREGALIGGMFANVATSLLAALFVFVLVTALTRAVLAPGLPAWRITEFDSEQGRIISRRVALLAAIFCVDLFFERSTRFMTPSPELWSVSHAAVTVLEALILFTLTPARLWQPAPPATIDNSAPASPPVPQSPIWGWARRIVAAIAVVGIVAVLAGYVGVGRYLVENTLYTGLVLGAFGVMRGLVSECIDVFAQSALARERLHLQPTTLHRWRFWLRAAIDPVLVLVAAIVVASYWGVPREDLMAVVVSVVRGFKIGNVTFSPADLVMAMIVFMLAMAATRVLQRVLVEKILPETRMEVGARHSLGAGVGYVGVVVAAALAVAVAGVDLTNIALVAGALSVGIGFGLQNIVNNFVSGLILLVERPINVGDWVVIGGKEGTVKRINFRATEIETFQRASVVIPNAEIISSSVTNWTLKDRMGRIEIPIGVAYASDTEAVKASLLECAKAHSKVLRYPEPHVLFRNFGDSSLDFELRCFTGDVTERIVIESDIRFAIDNAFRKKGIDIPFPQRVVHFAPGHGPAMPPTETKRSE